MYGPLVLAVLQGTEGLTTGMMYGVLGPENDRGLPMPEVTEPGIWFERAEPTTEFTLRFQSKGKGPVHTLVPLAQVMDRRYSVYVRNSTVT
jgi:hypothetical protein